MKMNEIINLVSHLYREQRGRGSETHDELLEVICALDKAEENHFETISHADYEMLKVRQVMLEKDIRDNDQYCEGISAVRELLMDLGFETEVE